MNGELGNVIIFSFSGGKLRLLLENEFTLTAGMVPNVNSFLCNYHDFALLGSNPGVDGSLQFWSTGSVDIDGTETGDPDFALERCTIVDAEVFQYGNASVNQGLAQTLVWRLMIADRRHNLVAPRGGILIKGELNKTPYSKASGGIDAAGNMVSGPGTATISVLDANGRKPYTCKELVQMCIEAMGLKDEVAVPQELSDAPRPNDLDWRGNHAPTELEKILTDAGWVFTIDAGGNYSLVQKNKGDLPTFPGDAVKLPIPGIDRRGKTVVFSSFPYPILDTIKLTGPADYLHPDPDNDEIEYCYFDPGDQRPGQAPTGPGKWITLKEASERLFNFKDPAQMITFGYDPNVETIGTFGPFGQVTRAVDPSWMSVAITSLFRTVRINPKNKKWGPTPILQDVFLKGDNWAGKPSLWAIHPLASVDGSFANSKDKVRINIVNLLDKGKVVVAWDRLMKIKKPYSDGVQPTPPQPGVEPIHTGIYDLDSYLEPLAPGDLELSATFEVKSQDSDGEWVPTFFYVGYQSELGQIVELTDAQTQTALLSPDTIVVSRPELVLHRANGVDQNRKSLTDQAANMAPLYIRGSGSPSQQWHVRGFKAYMPTGQISKVTITQSPPMTIVDVNTWFLPHGVYLEREKQIKGGLGGIGSGEQHPGQVATERDRMAQGQTGASLNSLPVAPYPPVVAKGVPHGVCRVDARNNITADGVNLGGAQYIATILNGVAAIDPYTSFQTLAGMTDGAKVLAVNVIEPSVEQMDGGGNDDGGSHWIVVGNQGSPSYANFEYIGVTDKGLGIVAISVPNPHSLFAVVLQKDGGADGDGSMAASWTYTCLSLSNDVLATKASPEWPRDIGPISIATRGQGYFDAERKFHLAVAYEVYASQVECDPS